MSDDFADLYNEWRKKKKVAHIHIRPEGFDLIIDDGDPMYYPFGQKGMLATLAEVVAISYEVCGVREIKIHDLEEVN